MADPQKQPVIVLLTSHWVTMAGVALVTLAGFSWLFALPENIRGNVGNPYIGLLVFMAIPAVFFAGLALIPIGIALGRRRAAAGFGNVPGAAPDRRAAWRRAGIFFAIMTVANLVIGKPANLSRRGAHGNRSVLRTELPRHAAGVHGSSPPAAPGSELRLLPHRAGCGRLAQGQDERNSSAHRCPCLIPIRDPSNPHSRATNWSLSADTCEHATPVRGSFGQRLRLHTEFKDDEANTRMETVKSCMWEAEAAAASMERTWDPGVHIRYAAADKKRQTIPWVEYSNSATNITERYLASAAPASAAPGGAGPAAVSSLPTFEMQCVDCHNRAPIPSICPSMPWIGHGGRPGLRRLALRQEEPLSS